MRGVDFFTVKVPTFQCVICDEVLFKKNMYVYFQDLFDLSIKQAVFVGVLGWGDAYYIL